MFELHRKALRKSYKIIIDAIYDNNRASRLGVVKNSILESLVLFLCYCINGASRSHKVFFLSLYVSVYTEAPLLDIKRCFGKLISL